MSEKASAPQALKVGVSGHRKLGSDPRTAWRVHAECVRRLAMLQELAAAEERPVEAYSALAIGADQLFARAALGLGIPVVGVIPFADYPADFEGPDREAYETLKALCCRVHAMPHQRRTDRAYLEMGHWVVDQADYLVAVWNGLPAAGMGGTGDVVAYARRNGTPVLRIDPAWPAGHPFALER